MFGYGRYIMKSIKVISLCSLISVLPACMATDDAQTELSQPMADTQLQQAIVASNRSEKNIARDIYRNPKKTLEFFGFKSTFGLFFFNPIFLSKSESVLKFT